MTRTKRHIPHPVVQEIFRRYPGGRGASLELLALNAGICVNSVKEIKAGIVDPKISTVSALLTALGYSLTIAPLEEAKK